jgi:hypothetical protein
MSAVFSWLHPRIWRHTDARVYTQTKHAHIYKLAAPIALLLMQ